MTARGLPALNELWSHYGGNITVSRQQSPREAAAFKWYLSGKAASDCIRELLPHLTVKRDPAEIALQCQDLIDALPERGEGGWKWTKETVAEGERLLTLIHSANQRGPQTPQPMFVRVGNRWMSPQLDLFGEMFSDASSTTFPKSGSMRNGAIFQRKSAVRPTRVTGFFYWPTAVPPGGGRVSRFEQGGQPLDGMARNWISPMCRPDSSNQGSNRVNGPKNLDEQTGTWPSPNTCPEAPNNSTNRGNGQHRPRETSQGLGERTEMWNTPMASISHADPNSRERMKRDCKNLATQAEEETWATPNASMVTMGDMQAAKVTGRPAEAYHQQWSTPRVSRGRYTRDKGDPTQQRLSLEGETEDWTPDLWPTPTTPTGGTDDQEVKDARGSGAANLLTVAEKWPTPNAGTPNSQRGSAQDPEIRRAQGHQVNLQDVATHWQTPATDSFRSRSGDRKDEMGLDRQARTWATPASRGHKGSNSELHVTETGTGRRHMDQLPDQVAFLSTLPDPEPGPNGSASSGTGRSSRLPLRRQTRKRLNVLFDEWLMGLPPGWTDVYHQCDKSAYGWWEMASCRSVAQLLSQYFGIDWSTGSEP
jgi:hypothetical protein